MGGEQAAPAAPRRRLIAIVGATATGKTSLALDLARETGGEVVNADSRQVYRGMDIGTAKPTRTERAGVRHHVLDVADPDETLTLAGYVDLARSALEDIWSRGRQPLLVGGTGQYVWALIEGWEVPRVAPDARLRAQLEDRAAREGTGALVDELRRLDPAAAARIDPRNTRRLVRAIEVSIARGPSSDARPTRTEPPFDATVLGIQLDRAALHLRIDGRVDEMLSGGLLDEVRGLVGRGYGCDLPAMSGIGYRQICEHLAGRRPLASVAERMKTETHRLARMQRAWFKPGDARITWLDAGSLTLKQDALASVSAARGRPLS